MNHVAYLKRIRFLHIFLVFCAVALTAFGFLMGGIIALIFSVIVIFKFHRCSKCGGEIDLLLQLKKETCCPHCGFYLKDASEPEEMRIERERAEAEAKAKAEAEAEAKAAAEAEAAAAAEAEAAETGSEETPPPETEAETGEPEAEPVPEPEPKQ